MPVTVGKKEQAIIKGVQYIPGAGQVVGALSKWGIAKQNEEIEKMWQEQIERAIAQGYDPAYVQQLAEAAKQEVGAGLGNQSNMVLLAALTTGVSGRKVGSTLSSKPKTGISAAISSANASSKIAANVMANVNNSLANQAYFQNTPSKSQSGGGVIMLLAFIGVIFFIFKPKRNVTSR